jgi:hypothetical protein
MKKELTLEKLDDEIAELFEKGYKSEVAINTIMNLLLKKEIFTEEEFMEEMKEIRRRVREE